VHCRRQEHLEGTCTSAVDVLARAVYSPLLCTAGGIVFLFKGVRFRR
jgi:hypothetical protein